jgi:hypothetical protein
MKPKYYIDKTYTCKLHKVVNDSLYYYGNKTEWDNLPRCALGWHGNLNYKSRLDICGEISEEMAFEWIMMHP